MLQLILQPRSSANFTALIAKMTTFFSVQFEGFDTSDLNDQQRLVGIFLALLQTSYAFNKEVSGQSLQSTAAWAFNNDPCGDPPPLRLTFRRVRIAEPGAFTTYPAIELYNNNNDAQSGATILHEMGHYFNFVLCGGIGNLNPQSAFLEEARKSPLGRLSDLDNPGLTVNGEDISTEVPDLENEPRKGMKRDPYTQNNGRGCLGDASCVRNELIADMFMNWVYEEAQGPVIFLPRTDEGDARRKFMEDNMNTWISKLKSQSQQ
jgi:hypothetical protein